ncbi:MAG: sugar transferase [Clostridia bacterium]|nr:sugar transferase [Clostridia bacterium]
MYRYFFKRFFDIILSLLAIIVLSPVLLILTITGAIAMRGNPFFTQERPGEIDKRTGKERIFRMIKFRTMSNAKDKDGNLLPDDERLNKYGRFLRSTSLDELPELFNILIGDMSIVGPRPLLVRYLPYYTDEERHRHDVRPGLTGLAQINGRNLLSWNERFALDLKYIETMSLWNDIAILWKTVFKVLKRKDIAVGKQHKMESLDIERGDMLCNDTTVNP